MRDRQFGDVLLDQCDQVLDLSHQPNTAPGEQAQQREDENNINYIDGHCPGKRRFPAHPCSNRVQQVCHDKCHQYRDNEGMEAHHHRAEDDNGG